MWQVRGHSGHQRGGQGSLQVPLQLGSGILAPTNPSTKIAAGRGCSISKRLARALQPGLGWEFPSWKKGVYSLSV